jgi:hypothetical protein
VVFSLIFAGASTAESMSQKGTVWKQAQGKLPTQHAESSAPLRVPLNIGTREEIKRKEMDFSQGGSDDTVFDKRKLSPPFIHALFRGACWLRYLILLHKKEYREDYTTAACQALEVTVMDLFTKAFLLSIC